jgi:hypothetical protein
MRTQIRAGPRRTLRAEARGGRRAVGQRPGPPARATQKGRKESPEKKPRRKKRRCLEKKETPKSAQTAAATRGGSGRFHVRTHAKSRGSTFQRTSRKKGSHEEHENARFSPQNDGMRYVHERETRPWLQRPEGRAPPRRGLPPTSAMGQHSDKLGPLEADARKRIAANRRRALWRARHPDEAKASNDKHNPINNPKRKLRDPNTQRERDQERYFRHGARWASPELGELTVTNPRNSLLLWMDTNGNMHREDTRSAEQLIRDFERGKSSPAQEKNNAR